MLIDLVIFQKDVLFWLIESWLERTQHSSHELRIRLVVPVIVRRKGVTFDRRSGHFKVNFELNQEILKQEVFVDVRLDAIGQLFQNVQILFLNHGVVLVVAPVVIEILFEFSCHLGVYRPVVVEIFEEQEPLSHPFRVLV